VIALKIAARELLALVRSPIAYVVGVAFLVVQGVQFAALIAQLSDPAQPAPLGAVLEGQFGATWLHWTLQIAIVAALAMRTVAEDRASGTWEVLLTAPVTEAAAVVGKWLAALAFYALLWLPTLAYLAVIAAYAPPGAAFEPGPVAAAYLGELVVGASFLAVGVAASAATRNQIVAAVAAFTALLLVLALGEAAALAPGLVGDGALASVARAVSVRGHLAAFARGELPLAPLVIHAGLTLTALSAAIAAARAGRRRRDDVLARVAATALIASCAVLAAILAVRHPRALDVTARGYHTLAAETRAVLARCTEPVTITVVRPAQARFDAIFEAAERAAARMGRAQPLVTVRRLDPALDPARAAEVARDGGLRADQLATGGAVEVVVGGRRRVLDLVELVELDEDALRALSVARLHVEEAITEVIAGALDATPAVVCVTTGHGELGATATPDGLDASLALDRVRRDGIAVEPLDQLAAGVPASCTVVAALGPTPLRDAEQAAIAEHVARGGALLVAARSRRDDATAALAATGLEAVLGGAGLALGDAVVLDPAQRLGDAPPLGLRFQVVTTYGDHPAVRGFAPLRATAWEMVRPVIATPRVGIAHASLVTASAEAELVDIGGAVTPRAPGAPPPALAVWAGGTGGPVVLVGSAESLSSAAPRAGRGAGDLLLASLLEALAGRARPDLSLPAEAPPQVRLIMTSGQRRAVFALCIGALPLGFAALGITLGLWRRRRRA